MNTKNNDSDILYHIGLSRKTIQYAEYAVLINDKQYVEGIAKLLDKNAVFINENREYYTYIADVCSNKVAIISTGFGCPAMGIALEEMATIGLKYFIRLGEIGAIQSDIKIGDLILSKAAMRYDDTSQHYAPDSYPAVASFEMTNTFQKSLEKNNLKYYYGITATSDTFWPSQGRKSGSLGFVPKKFANILDEWNRYRVLGVEMELATLFTLTNIFNLEAVAVLDTVNRVQLTELIEDTNRERRLKLWNSFLKHAIESDMKNKNLI